jgi:hypothetical protein
MTLDITYAIHHVLMKISHYTRLGTSLATYHILIVIDFAVIIHILFMASVTVRR